MEEEIRAQLEANAMAMMSWDEKVILFINNNLKDFYCHLFI